MALKTPTDIFRDWLANHDKEARVAVVIDSDRFLADAKVLDKSATVDPSGREWQLAVFRGDDLAFRLRFLEATAKGRTVIVLSRGAESTAPIDVSFVADVLAKNEAGPALDLSMAALFRRVAPKINFPIAELRRFRGELLARLEHLQEAADKVIYRWGKPDSWGRGQVAAMVLLAHHPELNLSDIWPDEDAEADFLAHVVKLLVGLPQLRPHRAVVQQVIHEAAREQVAGFLYWADSDPGELAAYLVLRDFAGQVKLQNPSTQLAGLHLFSPDLPLAKMEPVAMNVIAALKMQQVTWAATNQCAENFLTPPRVARVLELVPASGAHDAATLVKQGSPAILRQQLASALQTFFQQTSTSTLAWAAPLESHPILRADEPLSERSRQCRAALNLLLRLNRIEQRIALKVPKFPHVDALLEWFTGNFQHLLELDLAKAHHELETSGDDGLLEPGQQYLFGGPDELRPSAASLKGRVLARMRELDEELVAFVKAGPEQFGKGARSVRGLLRDKIDVGQISADTLPGRVWVLIFDGMRFDSWETVVKPLLAEYFTIEDAPYFCVLPSFTAYARTGLLAGGLPTEWKGFKGTPSENEKQLFAVNMGLTAQEKSKLRFVTEADTTKARAKLSFTDKDAALVNVLIYPVSDKACHEFGGDLAAFNHKIRADILGDPTHGVRGILDDLLKRIGPDDTVVLSSDHGFVELLPGDSVEVAAAEAKQAGKTLEATVRWRYIEGFAPAKLPEAVAVSVGSEKVWMAPARQWFCREGTKDTPRYTHGGLSLAEVVVPGVVLRRVTEKVARAELMDLPVALSVQEDETVEMPVTVRNSGTSELNFEVRVLNNIGEELLAQSGSLAPANTVKFSAHVFGRYKETSDRETDLNQTVTAVSLRMRHTDLHGQWRDAIDGLISIPVQVKPKAVKFETDALKSFDDI